MPPIEVTTFASHDALTRALAALLHDAFAHQGGGAHGVLLAGGSTPLPAYQALTRNPPAIGPGLHIALSDERHVPRESPESNQGNMRPMFEALGLPEERCLRVHTELSLADAAQRFHCELESFLDSGGHFSLAVLGLGDDGHTCSLFTAADVERAQGVLAAPIERPSPPHRVTVSPKVLEGVDRIVFALTGANKADALDKLLHAPQTIAAGLALANCGHVEVWESGVLQ